MDIGTRYRRRRRMAALASGASIVLAVTACGSSTSSSTPSSTSSSATGSAGSSQPPVTSGKPIDIAMPNLQGSTEGVNLPETSAAAQAAVDWINQHGGVQGRPLHLTVCDLLTTPASDVSCANSMAASGAVAVVGGGVDSANPIVTALANAKIPYVTDQPNSPLELSSPDAFAFAPGNTGDYAAIASYEGKRGSKAFSLILIGAAGSAAVTQQTAGPIFSRQGIVLRVILTPPTGIADLTPTLQSATTGNPSGVYLDEDPTTCIAGLNAKGTLQVGSAVRFWADPSCESSAVVHASGANANNTLFTQIGDPSNTADPDYATYNSAMNQYAPGVTHLGFAPVGFLGVMDLYRVMKTIPTTTPITPANVKAALAGASNVKSFLGNGSTFTCNGTAIKSQPSICGKTAFIEEYTGASFKFVQSVTVPPGL